MSKKSVYLCGPIGGCTFEEANDWRESLREVLQPLECVSPLRPFKFPDRGIILSAYGEPGPGIADYSLRFQRDHADVHWCDALLVNFIGAKRKSIGSAMEIAWACERRIPIVVAMEPGNVNEDVFLEYFAGAENRVYTLAHAVNKLRWIFNLPQYETSND